MDKIQMVDLKSQYENIETEIDSAIKEVITTSNFINGKAVKEFSRDLKLYLDVKHVIPCGNGTDAIQIALMSLDLNPGDEVITSTFTFIATAEVIALLGLVPVFVDVDKHHFTINPNEVRKKITSKTKVILPVHLYGQCAPMEEIMKIAKEHSVYVIEDTAQAIGSNYTFLNGVKKPAGTIGDIGTTSFFPSKNLGCYGDGGAIFTNDDCLADKLKMITNHGSRIKYHHEIVGVNSRLDSIQAAVLKIKLPLLNSYSQARFKAAQLYSEGLKNTDWIITPKIAPYSDHVFHQYTLQITNGKRNELKEFLELHNIASMVYYPIPLHKQKAFLKYTDKSVFKCSDELEAKVLSLPMHTELSKKTIDYIINTIKKFK
jgi:dTDP-4-amino-4,6-dideoxygalactose transaminase